MTIFSETQHQLHNSSFRGCCNHDYRNVCSHLRLYSLPSCILHGGEVTMVTGAFKRGQWNPRKFLREGHILKIAPKKKPAGQRDQTFRNAFETHSLTSSYLHSSNPLWPCENTSAHTAVYVWAHAENGWFINVKRKCRITSSQQNNRQKQKWATVDFYLLFPSRLLNWRSSCYFAVLMVGKCKRTIRSL